MLRRAVALLGRTHLSANRVRSEHSCSTAQFGSNAPCWGQPMAKIFLSYDHGDADRARPLAQALERAGHFVWWDLHIRGGEQFSKKIDEALQAADAVVVLWSIRSIESAWVRDEAAAGRESGRLIPVSLDDAKPPLGFRQYQTIDLSHWKGRGKPAQLQSLLADVDALAGSASDTSDQTSQPRLVATPGRAFSWRVLVPVTALLIAIGAVVGWKQLWPSSTVLSIAVHAAQQTASAQALARDLFVKLGSLQPSNAEAVQLVSTDAANRPDLIFEVGGDASAAKPHANLILLSGTDRSLFWSKEFHAPAGEGADLRQQLGFTAARIVGCALQALNPEGEKLREGSLKLYLNACAVLAESSGLDSVIPMFRQVTGDAPEFEGGWQGLLSAEIGAFQGSGSDDARRQLERDIEAARKVNPNLVEIILAEFELSPTNDYSRRFQLASKAVATNPSNPLSYAARSTFLMAIGQKDAAVEDAQKAVQLDPLSPPIRDNYIQALAYAGRIDTALEELASAQRLWPGASNIDFVRFRIRFRYGDAGEALRQIRSDPSIGWGGTESYLKARTDPSPANVARAIDDTLRAYQRRQYGLAIGHLAQVYSEFGRQRELMDVLLEAPEADIISVTDVMFRPKVEDFWKDPRALLIARRTGLLQFWQTSGKWPDFCLNRDLPYDCKKEAAKLLA